MGMFELYKAYNIDIAPSGHKHGRVGWINTECPHCTGTSGYHLGFHKVFKYYSCHRCGYHNIVPTLEKLLHVSKKVASQLAKEYEVYTSEEYSNVKEEARINITPFKYPSNTIKMGKAHHKYLTSRGFDSKRLEKEFELMGTGPASILDGIRYNFRIIAPIYWEGQVVSFQSRDYTKKQEKRYLACPMARERVHHKHIIYGKESTWHRVGICVEGIFDVWRFRDNTFCTFGIAYTDKQVFKIAKLFDRVFIAFDPERQAQRQADKLASELQIMGVEIIKVPLVTDPGDMSQEEADYLRKQLIK